VASALGLLRGAGELPLGGALTAAALALVALAAAGLRPQLTLTAALALLAGGIVLAAHDGDTSPIGVTAAAAALVVVAESSGLALRAQSIETVERRAALLAWGGVVLTSLTGACLAGIVLAARSWQRAEGLPLALSGAAAITALALITRTVARRAVQGPCETPGTRSGRL
jgi:hypothetical protein